MSIERLQTENKERRRRLEGAEAEGALRAVRHPTARPAFGDVSDLIGRDFCEVTHLLWPVEWADEPASRTPGSGWARPS